MIYKLFELKYRLDFLIKFVPKIIKRKIKKKYFKFFFIPTNHTKLPSNNWTIKNNYDYQNKLIDDYKNNLRRNSFITCPHLMELLLMKYKKNEEIIFLDMGADNIDFFLELNSNFENVKYFFYNLKSVNNIFEKLKFENNYKNLFIINEIDDILDKKFDFVNFGSSIEYFENYESILEKISNIGENIFFSGTTLFDTKNEKYNKHMIVKQVNMPDVAYMYFFNKKYFFSFFLNKNFKLLFENKNLTDNVNYNNFNKIFDNIGYMDFLFTKK